MNRFTKTSDYFTEDELSDFMEQTTDDIFAQEQDLADLRDYASTAADQDAEFYGMM